VNLKIFQLINNIILTHSGSISDFSMINEKFNVYHFPMIEIEPIDLKKMKLKDYDYFIFTSKNGVDSFISSFEKKYKTIKAICAGKNLYERMKKLGFEISYNCKYPYKEKLIDELIKSNKIKNKEVLYLTGNLSDNFIEKKLKNHCKVSRKNIYKTTHVSVVNHELKKILSKNICILIFTSPSSFDSFTKKYKIKNQKIGAIGKTTMDHIQNNNFKVDFTPKLPSFNDLSKEINKYINKTKQ